MYQFGAWQAFKASQQIGLIIDSCQEKHLFL